MASSPMVPHSFPGLLEDTWPGMPQWSTLVLHHTCSATMPSHSGVHFRMVVKYGMRPDFLENIFTPNIIFVFLRDHFFYYSAPFFYRVRVIPNSEISGTYRVPDR